MAKKEEEKKNTKKPFFFAMHINIEVVVCTPHSASIQTFQRFVSLFQICKNTEQDNRASVVVDVVVRSCRQWVVKLKSLSSRARLPVRDEITNCEKVSSAAFVDGNSIKMHELVLW